MSLSSADMSVSSSEWKVYKTLGDVIKMMALRTGSWTVSKASKSAFCLACREKRPNGTTCASEGTYSACVRSPAPPPGVTEDDPVLCIRTALHLCIPRSPLFDH